MTTSQVTIEVDDIIWDGVEFSALHHVHPIIEKVGFKFFMSVQHYTTEGRQGTGFEYDNGRVRVAYCADGNIARLTCNETGIELPKAIEVVEKKRKRYESRAS